MRAIVTLACLLVAFPAAAQNVDIQHGRPAVGTTGLNFLQGARPLGQGQLTLGLQGTYIVNPLLLHNGVTSPPVVTGQLGFVPTASYGVTPTIDVGLSWLLVPYEGVAAVWNSQGFVAHHAAVGGAGDIWLQGHFYLLPQDTYFLNVAAVALLRIPCMAGKWLSDGGVAFAPEVQADRTWQAWQAGVNVGAVFRSPTTVDGLALGQQFRWRAGLGYQILTPLQVSLEAFGLVGSQAPSEAGVAGRYRTGPWLLSAALGRGLSGGYGAPAFRVSAGAAWAPEAAAVFQPAAAPSVVVLDPDHDGIVDPNDLCPTALEDGRPPNPADGCPSTDTDGDGLADPNDVCPSVPADPNHSSDSDGCPTSDIDGDGVPDYRDRCPSEPGDPNSIEPDEVDDGCPPDDADHDGIPDSEDKCPQEAEVINGIDDTDGCPDAGQTLVELKQESIELKDNVYFGVGTNVLLKRGFQLLDQLAALLKNHKTVRIRIEGFTDDQGSTSANLRLSQRRAEAVRHYLEGKGIDPKRMAAAGHGESQPRAPNKGPRGRALNRRVTITVLHAESVPGNKRSPERRDKKH